MSQSLKKKKKNVWLENSLKNTLVHSFRGICSTKKISKMKHQLEEPFKVVEQSSDEESNSQQVGEVPVALDSNRILQVEHWLR